MLGRTTTPLLQNSAEKIDKMHLQTIHKLNRAKRETFQQLVIAKEKLATKHCENCRRLEEAETEIKQICDCNEEFDTVAVVLCEEFDVAVVLCEEFDADQTPPVPVDRHEPEPEPVLPDHDNEMTLGDESTPRNSTPSSMVATSSPPPPLKTYLASHRSISSPL